MMPKRRTKSVEPKKVESRAPDEQDKRVRFEAIPTAEVVTIASYTVGDDFSGCFVKYRPQLSPEERATFDTSEHERAIRAMGAVAVVCDPHVVGERVERAEAEQDATPDQLVAEWFADDAEALAECRAVLAQVGI